MFAVPLALDLSLSWDLLVIVFFAIVCAYSFIVGKHESVKIIIATYIAIVAIQGVGNLVAEIAAYSQSYIDMMGMSTQTSVLSLLKLAGFVATIIFLAIRGGFDMEYSKDMGSMVDSLLVGAFGFGTAGLLLAALLTFVAGSPLLDPNLGAAPALQPLLVNSELVQAMVDYQNLWFSLPAILLVVLGFVAHESD
jgi:hypothetical protein